MTMLTIEQRLDQWKNELLDLTNRNRLLNLSLSTTRPTSIQLIAPGSDELYRTLLHGKSLQIVGNTEESGAEDQDENSGTALSLVGSEPLPQPGGAIPAVNETTTRPPLLARPGTALSALAADKTNRVAGNLFSKARASEQEQGINTLFLALGLLKWQESPGNSSQSQAIGGRERRAPLVMLPLKMEEVSRKASYRILAAGEDPEFNQTLVERLRRDFGITLTIELDEETKLADVFRQVRNAVAKQSGWEVLEVAHISNFQFHKLRMFADLTQHAAVATHHDIVRALGQDGAVIAPPPDGIPRDDELDSVISPRESFTVLDADASQLWAVHAASRGANLIIQGPPGTGKSQTITNIIAECIGAEKTVLFVSEKAAAIEVVHRRLTEAGLGEFCLMLHSQKANKKDVIADLGKRLEPAAFAPSSPHEDLALRQLQSVRADLNAYAEALHQTHDPLGESAFWAHGELAALHGVPFLSVTPPPVADLKLETLDTWLTLVTQVSRHANVLSQLEAHPWEGIREQELSLADRQVLQSTLRNLQLAVERVIAESAQLAEQVSLPAPTNVQAARDLAFVVGAIPLDGGLQSTWLDPAQISAVQSLVAEALQHATATRLLLEELHTNYNDAVLRIGNSEAIAAYEGSALARFFSSTFRRIRGEMRAAAKDGLQRPLVVELTALRTAEQVNSHLSWFRQRESQLSQMLGRTFDASTSSDVVKWEQTKNGVVAAAAILQRFQSTPPLGFVSEATAPGIAKRTGNLQRQLTASIAAIDAGFDTLRPFFAPGRMRSDEGALENAPLESIAEWLAIRLQRFSELDPWMRARASLAQADAAGLQSIVRQLVAEGVPPSQWADTVRRLVLTHWLDGVYAENPVLRSFRSDEHEATIARFRDLDHSSVSTAAQRLRRTLAQRQGRVVMAHGGEPQLLMRESRKRARHMPLRRLFERIPNLVPTLKPCLMMSPLSVAQFLPANLYKFDIVIFDEASQVRPHDAIGAIMRGKQLVVAGDSKQLPPTSFFDRTDNSDESEDDQSLKDMESILDALGAKGMRASKLLWHYRSRHEDLIAYSNQYFYDSELITFPTPAANRTPTRGVSLEYVPDARYEDERDAVLKTSVRVNRQEAKRVAALVMEHARTRPDESLAVVTLNTRQQEVVEDEIQQARSLDRSLDDFFNPDKPEPIFVKALELIQGDERDVIIIGIGFGKNAQGTLSHNFGPINLDGGERRLNVLVTRARHQVIVVSSILASDIDLSRTSKRGPERLKQYLDFAERGSTALEASTRGGNGVYESPFEFEVGEALKEAGYTVHRQVGCSRFRIDLAVVDPKHPGNYLLGIECDGRTYHQSKTARDRDRLRQEILERLEWTIHRVWSTDWIRSRDEELKRLIDHIEVLADAATAANGPTQNDRESREAARGDVVLLGSTPLPIVPRYQSQAGEAPPLQAAAPQSSKSPVTPYERATLPVIGFGDILGTPVPRIVDAVVTCVDIEGPIHRDLLIRRVANEWGYQRAGSNIARRIQDAINQAVYESRIKRKDPFLWPAHMTYPQLRGPASDGWAREIAHITDEEIALAMRTILTHAMSLTQNDLILQTARLLGYQRTGPDIDRRLKEVIAVGMQSNAIEDRGGRIQLRR